LQRKVKFTVRRELIGEISFKTFQINGVLFTIFQNDDFLPHTKLTHFGLHGYYKLTAVLPVPALPTLPSWNWNCCGFSPSIFQVFSCRHPVPNVSTEINQQFSQFCYPQEEYYCTLSFSTWFLLGGNGWDKQMD